MRRTLKKIMLIVKISFLSVFGTSRGLANIEEELAFLTNKKDTLETSKSGEKPTGKPTH